MTHGYTSHGHACCDLATDPRPTLVARCGGPGLCRVCAVEMNRLFHAPMRPATASVEQAFGRDEFDLTDPAVFALLLHNHVPAERTIKSTATETAVRSSIICDQDGEAWPCRVKQLLDDTDEPSSGRR